MSIPGFRKKYKQFKIVDKQIVGNWAFTNEFGTVATYMAVVNLKMPHIKTLVIDDANYLLAQETMSRGTEKGYDKHVEIAQHYYDFIMDAMKLREDLVVVFISHITDEGVDAKPRFKLFTTGKMIDKIVNVDGLFNYLLYAEKIEDTKNHEILYKFRTRTNGDDTCRSTKGCFAEKYINQDMKYVIDTITNFENGDNQDEGND